MNYLNTRNIYSKAFARGNEAKAYACQVQALGEFAKGNEEIARELAKESAGYYERAANWFKIVGDKESVILMKDFEFAVRHQYSEV
ncbi:MAG: hypothetical protein GOV01_02980 [Candidatus Altiarchaeota archaeon]|nr:hypothetical protein [Candidatus Altiarchaeota archaeon]